MNRTKSIWHIAAACLSSVVLLEGAASAQISTFIGSLANWQANPIQSIGDKEYTYLTQSGSWTGAELFTMSGNIPLGSNSLTCSGLDNYVGPFTLSFGYKLLITNTSNSFESMSLDVNSTGTTTLITKDIFDTEAALLSGTAIPTWSLTLINSSSGSTVSLPPIQTIWVRDTIAVSPSGSLLGVSNTAVQLPEPSSLALAGIAVSCGGVAYWRRRRSATIAT